MTASQRAFAAAARQKALVDIERRLDEQHSHELWFALGIVVLAGLVLFGVNRFWAFLQELQAKRREGL